MGKRKRGLVEQDGPLITTGKEAKKQNVHNGQERPMNSSVTVQIIVGTYEKVLHGLQATVPKLVNNVFSETASSVEFADTFLLSPHGSAIRCLAISPPSSSESNQSQRLILASGSSDQIINLYHVSMEAPSGLKALEKPTLIGSKVKENPRNRELGSLNHHGGSINTLHFPTRSKLLSAADDNTIAVARTRDWTVLSTIKAPIPKAYGRPSGDTEPLGGTPAGVNDFAVHPSLKLMVSVGRGEKCMRLWNLVTGKKAGVLSFERGLLQGVDEGRWASGEGRRVEWNSAGEEFVVGFERGCVVFGMV
jgi:protein MAK11